MTNSISPSYPVAAIWPDDEGEISEFVPERAATYLRQAAGSLSAPIGCVMLCASSIDSMLRDKGYSKGSLFDRIDAAATANLITPEMAKWAHQVRLDANDQRHADDKTELPNADDARRSIDFAKALAEFLYVLPAKVTRGLEQSDRDKI